MTADEIEQQVIERMGKAYLDYATVLQELNNIKTGKMVVVPHDMDHAWWMVTIGQHYIDQEHQKTVQALTA